MVSGVIATIALSLFIIIKMKAGIMKTQPYKDFNYDGT